MGIYNIYYNGVLDIYIRCGCCLFKKNLVMHFDIVIIRFYIYQIIFELCGSD